MNNNPEYNPVILPEEEAPANTGAGLKILKGVILTVVIVLAAAMVAACILYTRYVSVENGRWVIELMYEEDGQQKAQWITEHFPDLGVRYSVDLGGIEVDSDEAVLTLTDEQGATAQRLIEAADQLPRVRWLNLTGLSVTTGQYEQLRAAYPEAEIRWMVPVNGLSVTPDITEMQVGSMEELNGLCAVLDYLPAFRHVDLAGVQLTDSQLDEVSALAAQLDGRGIKLTWEIMVAGKFYEHTTTEVAFVGDYDADDLAELHRLPNLTSLILDNISTTDLTPVTTLTTLESLTVRNMHVDDVMVLADMYWLGSFFAVDTTIPQWQLDALQKHLPECIIMTIQ